MKKVLMVSYLFPPTGGSGVQRSMYFAKYLPEFGYEPVVIRGGTRPGREGEDATLLSGLEDTVGITVPPFEPACLSEPVVRALRRCGRVGEGVAWRLKRLSRRVEMRMSPDELLLWSWRTLPVARAAVRRYRPEIIYSTSPPVCNHYIAWRLKRETGLPWTADFRDLWTENWTYGGVPAYVRRRDRAWETMFLRDADAVVAVTDGYVRSLQGLVDRAASDKVYLVRNGFAGADRDEQADQNPSKFRLVYTGVFYSIYWSDAFLNALMRANSSDGRCVTFATAGSMESGYRRKLSGGLGDRFAFLGYIPIAKTRRMIAGAGALLLPTVRGRRALGNVAGKLYEYLASGRPILCLSESPERSEAAQLVRKHNAGMVCQIDDEEQIYRALVDLHDRWAAGRPIQGARREDIGQYDRRVLTRRLAEVFDSCLEGQRQNA